MNQRGLNEAIRINQSHFQQIRNTTVIQEQDTQDDSSSSRLHYRTHELTLSARPSFTAATTTAQAPVPQAWVAPVHEKTNKINQVIVAGWGWDL